MSSVIVLIGPMGAGKSTIGRLLASKLGFSFLDTDHVIEERTGANIPWIFDVEGEAGFRDREEAVLEELVLLSDTVVATGGGIVERQSNRDVLAQLNNVVYLTASIDQLVMRTSKDKKRPLLQVADPKSKIRELLSLRDPLYRLVASTVLVSDGLSPKMAAQKIADSYSV